MAFARVWLETVGPGDKLAGRKPVTSDHLTRIIGRYCGRAQLHNKAV